jgi:hypothetical protein
MQPGDEASQINSIGQQRGIGDVRDASLLPQILDGLSLPSRARLQQGRCYRGPIYVGFDFPMGLPTAYPERTALRWPKILLASASLRCEVQTVGTSLMPKSFAAATCPWFGLQGNNCDDSYRVEVLR